MAEDKFAFILNKFKEAHTLREYFVPKFEECYEYTLPQRESFYLESPAKNRADKIFDETAVVGVQEFASRLQSGMIPAFAKWFSLKSGTDVDNEELMAVDEQLEKVTDYVFDVINNSNFNQESHEAFLDLAIGTGCLLVSEGDESQPIKFNAVPLPQMLLLSGPDGKIDWTFRVRNIPIHQLSILYPKATYDEDTKSLMERDPNKKCEVIEATYKRYGTEEETWHFCVLLKKMKKVIYEEEYVGQGSNPWIVFRWSKASGEVYGRGPVFNGMSAIKTCNLVIEMILENAQMAISGVWQISDDGTINPDTINLVPGSVIPVAPNSDGLQPLKMGGNFNVADLVLQDMRHNIKKALYNEMLGRPMAKTPMSAREVAERQADLQRQIGAAYGRLQAEFIQPLIKRVVFLLKKQGRIQLPIIDGREIRVKPESPLSKAQQQQDVLNVDSFLELVMMRFGPQMLNMVVKSEVAAEYLAKKLGVPLEILREPEEREAIANQIAQMAQQGQPMPQQGGAGPPNQAPPEMAQEPPIQ